MGLQTAKVTLLRSHGLLLALAACFSLVFSLPAVAKKDSPKQKQQVTKTTKKIPTTKKAVVNSAKKKSLKTAPRSAKALQKGKGSSLPQTTRVVRATKAPTENTSLGTQTISADPRLNANSNQVALSPAGGQSQLGAVVSTSAPAVKPEEKNWSLMGNISRSRNLYDREDGNLSESQSFMGRLSIKMTPEYSTSITTSYNQDLKDSELADWGDSSVRFSRKGFEISPLFTLAPALSVGLPTSKRSKTGSGLIGTLGVSGGFGFVKGTLPEGVSLSGSIGLTRLFHQYEEALSGSVNTAWSSTRSVSAGYSRGRFDFSISLTHRNGWTYQGGVRESFEHSEEIGYSASDNLSISIGHTLAGSALKANAQDSNWALLNENDSTVYGSLTLTY